MYFLYLILKTPNGLLSLGIFLYSVILAIVSPRLKRNGKKLALWILCLLPVAVALVHFLVNGTITFWAFKYLYLESLVPLINLLPGKNKKAFVAKSISSSILTFVVCFVCLLNLIAGSKVHNYSRKSYTKSFQKMLDTLEKEYVLNSWKQIDYDFLRSRYLPQVQMAEEQNDETAYAAVVTEVLYRFYDSHVSANLSSSLYYDTRDVFAGNDFGFSMIRLDDGSVMAVLVDAESDAYKQGIHDGTIIISWNNQKIQDAIDKVECISPDIQFPVKNNEDFFKPIYLAAKNDDQVNLTFVLDDGSEKNITIGKWQSEYNRFVIAMTKALNWDMERRNFYSTMLDDECGYLQVVAESYGEFSDNVSALRHGFYPKLTELYAEKIQDLLDHGMKYLIVDIRNNVGGYDSVAGALASLFTDEKTPMVSFGYEDSKGYHIDETQYVFPDARYTGLPVVVLTNASCMSAGDGMAKFMSDCPNVTLMGITSSSGVNQNNGGNIYLTKNICVVYPIFLSLSSDGVPLIDTDSTRESRIPLDVTIPMTKEFALKLFSDDKTDYELEYAMNWLRKVNAESFQSVS